MPAFIEALYFPVWINIRLHQKFQTHFLAKNIRFISQCIETPYQNFVFSEKYFSFTTSTDVRRSLLNDWKLFIFFHWMCPPFSNKRPHEKTALHLPQICSTSASVGDCDGRAAFSRQARPRPRTIDVSSHLLGKRGTLSNTASPPESNESCKCLRELSPRRFPFFRKWA